MQVFLAILLSLFAFLGGIGPQWDGDLPNPGTETEAGAGGQQEWTAAVYFWICTDPKKCPDDIACPQCPEKK